MNISLYTNCLKFLSVIGICHRLHINFNHKFESGCTFLGDDSVPLTADDFLFLCNFDGDIQMIVTLDPNNEVAEINEENNDIVLSSLNFDVAQCPGNSPNLSYIQILNGVHMVNIMICVL